MAKIMSNTFGILAICGAGYVIAAGGKACKIERKHEKLKIINCLIGNEDRT